MFECIYDGYRGIMLIQTQPTTSCHIASAVRLFTWSYATAATHPLQKKIKNHLLNIRKMLTYIYVWHIAFDWKALTGHGHISGFKSLPHIMPIFKALKCTLMRPMPLGPHVLFSVWYAFCYL